MSITKYEDKGPYVLKPGNLESLQNKSVIITGGASGLGKAYAIAFVKASAFVTIADYDDKAGAQTVQELGKTCQFVKCDVRVWEQQVAVFEAAVTKSPEKSCDIVITNAGIIGADDLHTFQDPSQPSVKPDLRTTEVNLVGSLYTAKLALHYFRRQPLNESRDRCLILKSSIAAYADQPGAPQYNVSKWGVRGLFRNYRRVVHRENIRVNMVSPWYVRTPILSERFLNYLDEKGVGLATVDDCASAMLAISTNPQLHGKSFGIVPRKESPSGVMDLVHDDYQEGDFMKEWQEIVLDTAENLSKLA